MSLHKLKHTLYTLAFIISISFLILNFVKSDNAYMLYEVRQAFVKIVIENEIYSSNCTEFQVLIGDCDSSSITNDKFEVFGSGAILKKNKKNVVLTANHVCEQVKNGTIEFNDDSIALIISTPYIMTIDGMLHKTRILKQNKKNDICLLQFTDNKEKYGEIEVFDGNLFPGERVYNLAAPKGVFEPNNVLIFDGFYTGYSNETKSSMFSIYAEQGSSGSPVINNNGEIVSMIHSMLVVVNNVSLGEEISEIREILKNE